MRKIALIGQKLGEQHKVGELAIPCGCFAPSKRVAGGFL